MAENYFLTLVGAACGLFAAFFVFVLGRLWLQTAVRLRWFGVIGSGSSI